MFGLNGRRFVILLTLAALIFAGIQYGPAYLTYIQFKDFVQQEVKFALTSRKTIETIRTDIVLKAEELELPITRKDIRVTKQGTSFTLDFEYLWPIDLKVYKHDLLFKISETGETFENASD